MALPDLRSIPQIADERYKCDADGRFWTCAKRGSTGGGVAEWRVLSTRSGRVCLPTLGGKRAVYDAKQLHREVWPEAANAIEEFDPSLLAIEVATYIGRALGLDSGRIMLFPHALGAICQVIGLAKTCEALDCSTAQLQSWLRGYTEPKVHNTIKRIDYLYCLARRYSMAWTDDDDDIFFDIVHSDPIGVVLPELDKYGE